MRRRTQTVQPANEIQELLDGNALAQCHESYSQLRAEMDAWLEQSMALDPTGPEGGGEDEANYALAWIPHYLVTRNPKLMRHFENLFEQLLGWVHRTGLHGYEPEAEAHHGPEPFALFLPRYIGLRGEDRAAIAILEDAAEHIGNWVESTPAWYDYDHDVFRGYWLGTRVVRDDPRSRYETADHFRFIHMALAAYRYTGRARYLEWALRYGRVRAKKLVESPAPLPLLWDLEGRGLGQDEVARRGLRPMASGSHHIPGDSLAGAENLLASGALFALGDLFLCSGDEIFRQAARRIVEPLIGTLPDPYADPAAAAMGYYRLTFGDTRYDQQLLELVGNFPPEPPGELVLYFPQLKKRRGHGVGRRADMVYWGTWGGGDAVVPVREPTTAALSLAYQLTGEARFAARALSSAAARLHTARRLLRGGREHADMGCAVCSVAAGHGRNWGHGSVTGCYGPLIRATREVAGKTCPAIEIRFEEGSDPPADAFFSLVRLLPGDVAEASFRNASTECLKMAWRPAGGSGNWSELLLNPQSVQALRFSYDIRLR
jgi:hypothetical protein